MSDNKKKPVYDMNYREIQTDKSLYKNIPEDLFSHYAYFLNRNCELEKENRELKERIGRAMQIAETNPKDKLILHILKGESDK